MTLRWNMFSQQFDYRQLCQCLITCNVMLHVVIDFNVLFEEILRSKKFGESDGVIRKFDETSNLRHLAMCTSICCRQEIT